jgi:hypothetical protein
MCLNDRRKRCDAVARQFTETPGGVVEESLTPDGKPARSFTRNSEGFEYGALSPLSNSKQF